MKRKTWQVRFGSLNSYEDGIVKSELTKYEARLLTSILNFEAEKDKTKKFYWVNNTSQICLYYLIKKPFISLYNLFRKIK